jgi:hypothetical protein
MAFPDRLGWVLALVACVWSCRSCNRRQPSAPAEAAPPVAATADAGEVIKDGAAPSDAAGSPQPEAAPSGRSPNASAGLLPPQPWSIDQLRAQAASLGDQEFRIWGYVSKIYKCPPCPPGAHCKPCMGNNFVLSQVKRRLGLYTLDDLDVIVFAAHPEQVQLGKLYEVTVRDAGRRHSNRNINDLRLVRFRPLTAEPR